MKDSDSRIRPRKGMPKQFRKITIADVAKRAGVSIATVSCALRGASGVSEPNRARIRKLALGMGYVADARARALRGKGALAFGACVTRITNPHVAEVVTGIQSACGRSGHEMMLTISEGDAEIEARHLSTLLEHQVDALIMLPFGTEPGRRYANLKLLRQYAVRGVPIMMVVERIEVPGIRCGAVVNDLYRGGRLLMDHLLSLGHRRVATLYLADEPSMPLSRYHAYVDALNAAGISNKHRYTRQTGVTPEDASLATEELLKEQRDITAIVYPSDFLALAGLHRIRERRLGVPTDISVVAFEDLGWAAFFEVPLTTVSYPLRSMGELAVTRLADWLSSPAKHQQPLPTLALEPTLVTRASTGRPRQR
ncbi:MAG: LacI family DNA-binding transcriptional regulator [Phycisphaerae bacterium]